MSTTTAPQPSKVGLALTIATLVATALTGLPGIPAAVLGAIKAVSATLGVIMKSGVTSNISATAILATLASVIAVLKQQPGLSQAVLNDIAVLDNALLAALAADAHAQQQIDPSTLHHEDPIQ